MLTNNSNRRQFLTTVGVAAAGTTWQSKRLFAVNSGDRPGVASIGVGTQGSRDAEQLARHGNYLAVCDVDLTRAERIAHAGNIGKGKAAVYQDYRRILDRPDIDVVTISTPDHWHVKIAIEALQAGKDVYCQKPMSLTIDEGKQLCKVARDSKQVIGVGTQNRSVRYVMEAVLMAREGHLGKIKQVVVGFNEGRKGGPFKSSPPPKHLDWNMWLGPAPLVDYIPQRCHDTFRWWYEYAGGEITDWGAHFLDIAQWAIGAEQTGPLSVKPIDAKFEVPYKDGYPTVDDTFNTPSQFAVQVLFPDGIEMLLQSGVRAGVAIEGDRGKLFVNHGGIYGQSVEEQRKNNPIPEEKYLALRKGKKLSGHNQNLTDHFENFFECVRDRGEPASDVFSHHRTISTCHLANIALRLGRELNWDADAEQFAGDDDANRWLKREPRAGFGISL